MSRNITQTHNEIDKTKTMSVVINSSRLNIDDALYILNDGNILDSLSTLLSHVDNSSYRLNPESTGLDTLEQYVSQITAFHSSRMNLSYNKTSCIEFSIITPTVNQCNIIYDKPNYEKTNKKNSPIFSIITNLGDCTCPLLLTEINHQQYKYKQFTHQSHNKLIFLKKYMHAVFDSSKYHGFVDILNDGNTDTTQSYLLINLWSYPLDNIPYYSSANDATNCSIHMNFTDINEPSATQVVDVSGLNTYFFDQLLYNSKLILDERITTSINTVKMNSTNRIILQIKNMTSSTACNTVSTHTIPTAATSKKDNINTWCISNHKYHDNLLRDIDKFCGGTVLLDLTRSNYTLIEKYVYDIAMFHFARLKIHDIENHAIEFWCKSKFQTHALHVDCDESLKRKGVYVYPLLSCVTYLNDVSNCPTIITNADMDCYKYKDFESQTELILSLPVRNKQITFDGHFFHGSTTLFDNQDIQERYIIAINCWKTTPHDVKVYNVNNDNPEFERDKSLITLREDNAEICSVNVCSNTINYSLFNDILYNKKTDSCYRFNEIIKTIYGNNKLTNNTFKFILDHSITKEKKHAELKNKYGVIIDDIREISNDNILLKYNNRFLQRFSFPKIYSADMCRYIINECEKYAKLNGGWMTTRHHKYPTTDLPVDKIPCIFGIILETLKTITNKISISYGLHDDMVIDIKDLFVVKYSHDAQNQLEMHKDGSFISFNILLNESSEFEGGGTYFDDGLTSRLEQGDILIHSSRIKHSGLPITAGSRYLLVGFVNVSL